MKDKKSLNQKIVHSIFLYETKKITLETISKVGILSISLSIILIFGGVIFDIYTENELGDLLKSFITRGEYSFMKIGEMGNILTSEIPNWVLLSCLLGVLLGCILLVSIIKNWSSISHKIHSLVRYWFTL